MDLITSDKKLKKWEKVGGKFYYCYDHTEELIEDDMDGKDYKLFSAKYVVLDKKDEGYAKKLVRSDKLEALIVTTSTGKSFKVDPISRQDISDALMSDRFEGGLSWKLATGSKPRWQKVSTEEAKEALKLALKAKEDILSD